MQQLTKLYGDYIGGPTVQVPDIHRAEALRGVIDCIGVMIAGTREPATALVLQTIKAMSGGGDVRVLFGESHVSPPDAALVNGTAAHALDFDDIGAGLRGHPSTVLVPALLAEAEARGVGGAAVIDAYLAGYQIWGDLVRREPDHHHLKGFHPTGLLGTVAAGAACARLTGLDPTHAASAIGIAASQASGILSNFGSMTKPFHAGRAAQAGLISARLAEAGLTASADAIEHTRGFLRAYSPRGRVDLESPPQVETRWFIDAGLNIKQYPVCYGAHRLIDTARKMRRDLPKPEHIEAVEICISATHAGMLRNSRPQSALEAKFSAEFAVAASLIAGDVSLIEVQDDFVRRPDVQTLISRVTISTTNEELPDLPGYAPQDIITIRLRSGQRLVGRSARMPKGHAENPISDEALDEKFLACCAFGGWDLARAKDLLKALRNFDDVASIRDLNC